jgi:hypothetical protein
MIMKNLELSTYNVEELHFEDMKTTSGGCIWAILVVIAAIGYVLTHNE